MPKKSWKEQVVKRYADPYQAISLMALKWSVILGIAVAMMVLSRAIQKTVKQRATVMRVSLIDVGYSMSSSSEPFCELD